jgi:hypothetical protein
MCLASYRALRAKLILKIESTQSLGGAAPPASPFFYEIAIPETMMKLI